MNAGREHRVPLSDRALAMLEEVAKLRPGGQPSRVLFPGRRPRRGLSGLVLEMVLRRVDLDVTQQGGGRRPQSTASYTHDARCWFANQRIQPETGVHDTAASRPREKAS